ncbi:MAG: hypothetical protein V4722_04335 [Bacteroidota bacterium]
MASKFNFKAMSERATQAAGMVAGVAASRFIGTTLAKTGKVNDKLSAGIRIGIGAFLPLIVGGKGKKSGIINDVANGLMADAATTLVASFKVIPGLSGMGGTESFDAVSYAVQEDLMNGTTNYGAVSGND